jgi:hypothetical protein
MTESKLQDGNRFLTEKDANKTKLIIKSINYSAFYSSII